MHIFKILDIFPLFVLTTGLTVSKNETHQHPHRPTVIVVAWDSFHPELLQKFKPPTLNSLWESGPKVPYMEPVFPTNTFPNLHSIATGLYPESHGIIDNWVYDPKLDQEIDGFRGDPSFWNYDPDILPIWILNEMAGGHSACIAWPGCTVPYGRNTSLPTYFTGIGDTWEKNVNRAIKHLTAKSKPANLIFLYDNEVDSSSKALGPSALFQQVASIDKKAAYLLNSLKEKGLFEKVNIIMLSGHGFAEVNNHISLNWLTWSPLVEHIVGSDTFYNIRTRPGEIDEVYRRLQAESKKNFSVYKAEELEGDPFYYFNCDRILDIIIMADVGSAFHFGSGYPTSLNGYSHLAPEMKSIFIASGPAFTKGQVKSVKNVDVAQLIASILGIGLMNSNGSFERIKGLLHPRYLKYESVVFR